jgi:cysteine-S-conjugate beta-lyase
MQFGITHRYYDSMDAGDLAAKITHKTKLVWLEAPGSVTMEFPDLIALVKVCKERGVLCAIDNTWGAGLAFNAFDLDGNGTGVDISIQALTKYPSGGGDVMGSVVTRDAALGLKIKLTHMRTGVGVAANDAELVLRNLPSIALRFKAHDVAARHLAAWLQKRSEVEVVLHPALPGAPGHGHWKQLCTQQNIAGAAINNVVNGSGRGQGGWPVQHRVQRALHQPASRCVLRCPQTFQARLFMGWPFEPGSAL